MKKISFLLSSITLVLSANVNAMGPTVEQFTDNCLNNHEAPFLGINTKHNLCCIVANATDKDTGEQSDIFVGGKAEAITFAANKNFTIATCKINFPEGFTADFDLNSGRNKVEGCHIGGIPKTSHEFSNGGFTIDLDENTVSANCKAERII